MEKSDIFAILKEKVMIVLDIVNADDITQQASLKDLGANSIDRAEIVMMTLEALQVKAQMMEFAKAKNIDEICDILKEKC